MPAFDPTSVTNAITAYAAGASRPFVVAIDGRSGVGKTTLAGQLAGPLAAAVIEGDDFFAGGVAIRNDSAQELAADCIDWKRQRPVLEMLRNNERARWHRFDWVAFDGSLEREVAVCDPARVILFEGVYSARPELADLVDLRILLRAAPELRLRQLVAREGSLGQWEAQWHAAEDYYFANTVLPEAFDIVLDRK